MDDENDPLPLSLVIVGDGNTGKSCLLLAYVRREFPMDYIPSVVDTYRITLQLKHRRLQLDLFDTRAGYGDSDDIMRIQLHGKDVAIVCYDCTNRNSFLNAQNIWVPLLLKDRNDVFPFIVAGTKEDIYIKNDVEHVSSAEGCRSAMISGAFAGLRCSSRLYGETQLKQGNVENVFKVAIKAALIRKGIIKPGNCCMLL